LIKPQLTIHQKTTMFMFPRQQPQLAQVQVQVLLDQYLHQQPQPQPELAPQQVQALPGQ
jgi:hypothetical protein